MWRLWLISGVAAFLTVGVVSGAGELATARAQMVRDQLQSRGITDERVLRAMRTVPRHEFVPALHRNRAYDNSPLPIGYGQTISQPYVVAWMTQASVPKPTDRALEIGTGSGYQAAVLSLLVDTVYSVEIIPELTRQATRILQRLEYHNVVTDTRDGYRGWREHAPFDIILVTAAADHIPEPLLEQLALDGRLVMPVGDTWQQLIVATRVTVDSVRIRQEMNVVFVPMTGEAERHRKQSDGNR